MKKYIYILLFISTILLSGKLPVSGQKLSPVAEVSIISCSPGEDLYSVFGHSAIRIYDPMSNIDYVYNYGTFDFGAPNFYLKFARGKLDYMLSVEYFKDFKNSYIEENRTVWEQTLELTHTEKQKLYELLETNAKPENKFYKYDFFFDNCATRIRDILQKTLNNKIIYPDLKGTKELSFRELIEPYMENQKWGDFGIDVLMGLLSDKTTRSEQYMFLPDELKKGFETAKIKNSDRKLLKSINTVYESKTSSSVSTEFLTPNKVFWGLFFLVAILSLLIWKRNPKRCWFDFFFFLIFGLLGILFLLMWFATDHKVTPWNLNILWALPSHAVIAFFLLKKNKPYFLSFYFLGTCLLSIVLLLAYKALPQELNISTIPIILTLALRSFIIFWKENRD